MSRRAALPQAATALQDVRDPQPQEGGAEPQEASITASTLIDSLTALAGQVHAGIAPTLRAICRQAPLCDLSFAAHGCLLPASPAATGLPEPHDQHPSLPGHAGPGHDSAVMDCRATAEQAAAGSWGFERAVAHFRQACGERIRQSFSTDRPSAEAASYALDAANRVIATLQPGAQPAAHPQDALARQLQSAARFWAAPDAPHDLLGTHKHPTQQKQQATKQQAKSATKPASKRARDSSQQTAKALRADRSVAKRAKHTSGVLSAKAQLAAAQLLELIAAGHNGTTGKVSSDTYMLFRADHHRNAAV